jgi:catechol 2,3-dioxygenase-like lactoylglutathione lyase family enzyme
MPTGKLSHLQVNVNAGNLPFYRDLLRLVGWDPLHSNETMEAFTSEGNVSLWCMGAATGPNNDSDGTGVNHIALAANSQAEVDRTVAFLEERGIARLFDTPRHRPDFSHDDTSTYYQVMFESPDGILFEHVYIGPKES